MPWPKNPFTLSIPFVVALGGGLVACNGAEDTSETGDTDTGDTDTGDTDPGPLALIGEWAEIGGAFPDASVWGYPTVTASTWTDSFGGSYAVLDYTNEPGVIIAQNGSSNFYNPDQFSRFDFASDDAGGFYYCQTAYAAVSQEDAANTPASDATDLDGGCGGFAWSHLVPVLPLDGTWTDGFATHTIDEASWTMGTSVFAVYAIHYDTAHLIAQNDADNTYFPSQWSRFDWYLDGSDVYYCQSTYNAADAEAAEAATPADTGDLTTGCGGFAWSQLVVPE